MINQAAILLVLFFLIQQAGMFLNYVIRHSTQVEMEMNSVERVKHYINVPTEDYEGKTMCLCLYIYFEKL